MGRTWDAVRAASVSLPRIALTLGAAVSALMVMLLSANTGYTVQMLSRSLGYLPVVLHESFFYLFPGGIWRAVLVSYAVLVGVTITTLTVQIRQGGLSFKGASGTIPGILAGGCAGCGAGLLTVFGAAGAITVLPFGGLSLMVLGIVLMLYYLSEIGDPESCAVG